MTLNVFHGQFYDLQFEKILLQNVTKQVMLKKKKEEEEEDEEEKKKEKNKYIVSIPTSARNVRSNLLQIARPRRNWHFAGETGGGGRGKHQAGEGS